MSRRRKRIVANVAGGLADASAVPYDALMAERTPKPKPVTAEWLMRAAAYYIERYASSTGNLRKVLRRKVMRRALALGEAPEQYESLVESTVVRMTELGLLDDRAYAAARVSSLRRRGTSTTMTKAKLIGKGLSREIVDETLSRDETEEAAAAAAYARRRRFGPHRNPDRGDRRDKEIAAMVRAGFAMRLAVAAVDGQLGGDERASPDDI